MSDGKFFALLLVGFGIAIIGALCWVNTVQPHGWDVELLKQIGLYATPIITALVVLLNSNANKRELRGGQEQIGQQATEAAVKAKTAAETVENLPDVIADKVLNAGEPSGLGRVKRPKDLDGGLKR